MTPSRLSRRQWSSSRESLAFLRTGRSKLCTVKPDCSCEQRTSPRQKSQFGEQSARWMKLNICPVPKKQTTLRHWPRYWNRQDAPPRQTRHKLVLTNCSKNRTETMAIAPLRDGEACWSRPTPPQECCYPLRGATITSPTILAATLTTLPQRLRTWLLGDYHKPTA